MSFILKSTILGANWVHLGSIHYHGIGEILLSIPKASGQYAESENRPMSKNTSYHGNQLSTNGGNHKTQADLVAELERIYGIRNGGDRKSDGHNVQLKTQDTKVNR